MRKVRGGQREVRAPGHGMSEARGCKGRHGALAAMRRGRVWRGVGRTWGCAGSTAQCAGMLGRGAGRLNLMQCRGSAVPRNPNKQNKTPGVQAHEQPGRMDEKPLKRPKHTRGSRMWENSVLNRWFQQHRVDIWKTLFES